MAIAPLALAAVLAGSCRAEDADGALLFGSATYSADEDCRWVVGSEVGVPGNPWYIGGPPAGTDREVWLAALQAYRREIRGQVHALRQVDLQFRGIRAWVRMRPEVAKPLDLRPGEPFRIGVEACWVEGNGELVLALDLLSRQNDSWQGWSTVFSTLDVPRDGEWHRLTWEGTLPQFDHEAQWAKLIVGMDATHDQTPGHVVVRDFAMQEPARAASVVGPTVLSGPPSGLDRSLYDRRDLAWASRAFLCHFTFLYDLSLFDPAIGQYRLDSFLDQGEREFGGYDALVLWHAYPRIGVDQRNQFDFYRDMPGGLPGLRQLVRRLHDRGVKVFLDYNPWDTGTRREGVSDEEAIAAMVAALEADGVFLDTMAAGPGRLREAIDTARRGVVFEPEGSPPLEQLEVCSASWAQGLPDLGEPGLLRLKWIEPRHLQHQISRWAGSVVGPTVLSGHQRELENAFFSGSGMLVWENVFGTWNPWGAQDRATLRRLAPILRLFAANLTADQWEPFVPTLVPGVYANAWPGEGGTVYTLLNRTGRLVREPVLRLPGSPVGELFDLWRGRRLRPQPAGDALEVALRLGPIGCVARVTEGRLRRQVEVLCSQQREEDRRALPAPDPHVAARGVVQPLPVEPTPPAAADQPPPGMVPVPAGMVTMNLVHQRRECGCYPDPGTPPERWPDFLWGAPHDGTIEHHLGPLELPAFFVDEHEVTNAEFARFRRESGYRPREPRNFLEHWGGAEPPAALADHPVVYVDLEDARAYARWAGKRLPTEPEWHRAAQGDDGRTWPWGNESDATRCNGDGRGTTPVTAYPQGRSPFGCYDMAGNVWEWTESERSDGHTRFCIIRGGSYFRAEGSIWYVPGGPQPCTSHTKFILLYPGLDRCATVGFRCVKDVAPG